VAQLSIGRGEPRGWTRPSLLWQLCRKSCSTLSKRATLSRARSFTKVEGQLVLPARILRLVLDADESLEWNAASMKRTVVVCRTNERVGAKVEVAGRRCGTEWEVERGVAWTGTTARYKTGRKWQVEGLLCLRGRIVCNRHSRTCPVLIPRRFPALVNARKYCRSHYS